MSEGISLKKRITKIISIVNLVTIFLVIISIIFMSGSIFREISRKISGSIAAQMGTHIEEMINYPPEHNKPDFLNNIQDMVSIGNPYIIFGENLKPDFESGLKPTVIEPKFRELIIHYKIWKENKLLYDSLEEPEGGQGKIGIEQGGQKYLKRVYERLLTSMEKKELKDSNGKVIGKIEVSLNPKLVTNFIFIMILGCLFLFVMALLISQIAIKKITNIIIKPLAELEKKMSEIAEGNIDEAGRREIQFKRPIIEIEKLMSAGTQIIEKMEKYTEKLENQNIELELQNSALEESRNLIHNTNLILDSKILKLRNILDNTGQGFLMFGEELKINGEYSLECEKIFKIKIDSLNFAELISKDNETARFTAECLQKIFNVSAFQREVFISILPEEICIDDKIIALSYKMVKDENRKNIMMAVLTDITEKRTLEKKMEDERKKLKMVVSAIINREDFIKLVNEYKNFVMIEFENLIRNDKEMVCREIHTFKGSFGQYEMINTAEKLNEIENLFYEKKQIANIDSNQFLEPLIRDMETVKKYAGEGFFDDIEKCYVNKDKLIEIEEKIVEVLDEKDKNIILPMVRKLRYRSLKSMLSGYIDYTMRLGTRLDKSINHFEIEGDDIEVEPNSYYETIKVLGHLFRNCVDHGIETVDERVECGKEEAGNISCTIINGGKEFKIIISDDGKGIDIEKIKNKAIDKGIITEKSYETMKENERINLIFAHGISAKNEATNYSGRGVGMSAVKRVIENNSGRLEIESLVGIGTKFIITLPKYDDEENKGATADSFIEGLTDTAIDFFDKKGNIKLRKGILNQENIIKLKDVTGLISMKGNINAIIMISVNQSMAEKIAESMVMFEVAKEELGEYIEDSIGEALNTILGNTLGIWRNTEDIYHVGIPAVIFNSGGYVKYTQSQILSYEIEDGIYEMSINMLLVANADIEFENITEVQ